VHIRKLESGIKTLRHRLSLPPLAAGELVRVARRELRVEADGLQ
jgi:hypothetical protein